MKPPSANPCGRPGELTGRFWNGTFCGGATTGRGGDGTCDPGPLGAPMRPIPPLSPGAAPFFMPAAAPVTECVSNCPHILAPAMVFPSPNPDTTSAGITKEPVRARIGMRSDRPATLELIKCAPGERTAGTLMAARFEPLGVALWTFLAPKCDCVPIEDSEDGLSTGLA